MTLSRRRFLKDTIAGASLIAAGQLDLVASAADEPKLIPGFSGLIITPKHALYDQARQNYNGRFSLKPASIACCENETDVVKAIEYVREHKIPFVIRSGGHSYEAFSLLDDGMVIDVSNLRSVIVSANK